MRCLGTAGISAVSNEISFLYRKQAGRQFQEDLPRFQLVLLLLQVIIQLRGEIVKVGVQCSEAVWMIDVDCSSKSGRLNLNPCYISVGCSIHGQIFPFLCFQVQTHVIVIRTKLSEVSTKVD